MEYEKEERKRDRLKRIYPEFSWICRRYKKYCLQNQCPGVKTCIKMYPNLICECGWRRTETMNKDFKERLIELVKDDKELHDATVRLINALAE